MAHHAAQVTSSHVDARICLLALSRQEFRGKKRGREGFIARDLCSGADSERYAFLAQTLLKQLRRRRLRLAGEHETWWSQRGANVRLLLRYGCKGLLRRQERGAPSWTQTDVELGSDSLTDIHNLFVDQASEHNGLTGPFGHNHGLA
jgi:hypothetical protein